MDYIKSVRSTLKGGCSVELGPKTVIVGPNGAGKSTIVQSIELATRGYVSDMEGRDAVKQQAALGRLFPESVQPEAAAESSGGFSFSWAMERKDKGGFRRPVHIAPSPVNWPLADLKKTLSGDSNTVGSWLSDQITAQLDVEGICAQLPSDVRETTRSLIKRFKSLDMLDLAKKAKSEARSLRMQATKDEKTLEGMLVGIDPPLTQAKRAELEAVANAASDSTGHSQEAYDKLKAQQEEIAGEYASILNELMTIPALTPEQEKAAGALQAILALMDLHTKGFGEEHSCALCGVGTAEAIQTRRKLVDEAMVPYQSSAKGKALEARKNALHAHLVAGVKTLNQMVVADPEEQAKKHAAIRAIAVDDANRRAWQNAESTRAGVKATRKQADAASDAGKELAKAGKRLVEKQQAEFLENVRSFLPEGTEFGVDLSIGRLGFVRDGQLHSALSGAEWSQVLLALGSTLDPGSTPTLLVPDDRAWDRDTLTRVMAALTDSPSQVIIMSTVRPDDAEGWTIVDLTRD